MFKRVCCLFILSGCILSITNCATIQTTHEYNEAYMDSMHIDSGYTAAKQVKIGSNDPNWLKLFKNSYYEVKVNLGSIVRSASPVFQNKKHDESSMPMTPYVVGQISF